MVELTLQPVRVAVGEDEGLLVFADGALVAVLVRLGSAHDSQQGSWFLETGYGALGGPAHPTWATVDEARAWMQERLPA